MGKKRPNKSFDKKDKKDKKLKTSFFHIIRRLFEQHQEVDLTYKQVCELLHVREGEARKLVVTILTELANENFLHQTGFATYRYKNEMETIEGDLEMTQRGAGFVVTGKKDIDIFIPPHFIGQAIHGDTVKVATVSYTHLRALETN
jgi:ribonuclease R